MTGTGLLGVAGLLGRFSDDMTRIVDQHFGSDWAENDEIIALVSLTDVPPPTTRQLSERSGLHRRATSRLVSRLQADRLVFTRVAEVDRRAIQLTLTEAGRERMQALERAMDVFFDDSSRLASDVVSGLGDTSQPESALTFLRPGPLGLLEQTVSVGTELVGRLPVSAGRSRLTGRERAALVRIASDHLVRPLDLGHSLRVGRSGVSYLVDRLCAKGLVERQPGRVSGDRRAVVLNVTDIGQGLVDGVCAAIDDARPLLRPLFIAVRDRSDRLPEPAAGHASAGQL